MEGERLMNLTKYLIAGLAICLVIILTGCEDFDRRLAEQEYRQRVFAACVPEEGQRVVAVREEDSIHFTRIDVGPGRYSRSFPHTEIRVSTVEGL